MCGITGVFHTDGRPAAAPIIERMTVSLAHRGPDGDGIFVQGPVGLGHRRLAIIDPTPSGSQPMGTEDGQLVLVYNGEIYNFLELRLELEARGVWFRSKTDTEVLLRAYEAWGPACVERLNGMFAFAVWDRRARTLFLARDRYGVKPLYYASLGTAVLFASEIKAILAYPRFPRRVCAAALSEYFAFQNILSNLTLFDGVKLLPPGHTLMVKMGARPSLRPARYWDYCFNGDGFRLSEQAAQDELYGLFQQAVNRQLVSDVPLGSYLSGGMDSGSITAIASRSVPRLPTFTCGFDLSSASGMELGFDERATSEMLSHRFKTEHYEVVLKAGDMEAVMPKLIWHLEDLRVGQCYPNYYIARLASKFVKVALSGIGGDELFGGYPWRYCRADRGITLAAYQRRYYNAWQRLVPDADRERLFNAETWRELKKYAPFEAFQGVFAGVGKRPRTTEDYVDLSLYFEAKTFLHGLFLVEDKLSMAHGLETRVPFLDNDLVDFAMRVPSRMKVANLKKIVRLDENEPGPKSARYFRRTHDGKQILRKTMARVIPSSVTSLAKQGFSAPDATWFRGESIEYVRTMLADRGARIYRYLSPAYIENVLQQHCSGQVNRRLLIWSLLSFEWWLREFME